MNTWDFRHKENKEDLFSEITSKVLAKWLENATKGDKIRIRKSLPEGVTGKAAKLVMDISEKETR